MTERAVVVIAENGKRMAQVTRSEMCESCKACRFGQEQTHCIDLPEGDFEAGDIVELTIPEGKVGIGSLVAYGIPLAGLLIGLGVAVLLRLPDIAQAVLALVFAAGGILVTHRLDKKMAKDGSLRITARKVE